MRSAMRALHIFLVLALLNAIFLKSEARPLHELIGEVHSSGPSPPGEGHKFTNSKTLGRIKDSGPSPSPGEGHKFTNSETLGRIKDSGPSPGEGHKFTNSETLGGIKDSGPSPGEGHGHITGTNQ
ncbi:hypothetical protein EUGRSUZ_H02235 [Eucalyptus grandis]|uniref:Uncharacterized protein n=3 Tax=Eucalyptus grandis TaxID=71139 RepID=A0A059B070_EUCGR|nr:hypothetical protein EUGRSUZ_H02232 [Eucalyptus grandis]KAK3416483.1 hypothetical protein EUGRSUZ_H02235 [Eucalyptus grandis]